MAPCSLFVVNPIARGSAVFRRAAPGFCVAEARAPPALKRLPLLVAADSERMRIGGRFGGAMLPVRHQSHR